MEEGNAVSERVYEILASADWEALGKKMLDRAIWRGSTRYRITDTTIFARGYSLEDAISYIIQSVFEGQRKWNPDDKDLEDWLLNQVDSVMDWWLKLQENCELPFEEFESAKQDDDHQVNRVKATELDAVLQYGPPDLEIAMIAGLDEEKSEEIFNALFDNTIDDSELQEVILVMMEVDDPKPSHVAKKLGVPVQDIYNRQKRLRRRLVKVMATLERASNEQEK